MHEVAYQTRKYSRAWWFEKWRNFRIRMRRWLLEDQAGEGLGGPPNNWRSTDYIKVQTYIDKEGKEYGGRYAVARFLNDAFEIGIGVKYVERGKVDEAWKYIDSTKIFRYFALWYLWRWAWGEWFGLRRWLFYKDLHRRVESRLLKYSKR